MVFSSLTFLFLFLPIVLILYYIIPKQLKNLFILISGLFFYAWGEPIYVFIMIASTLIDYFAGLVIYKFGHKPAMRKAALIISVIMNLSLLGFFKYSGFIIENINHIFGTAYGAPTTLLPIGISFFTFQSMSYTIDLYRGNINVQKNPITFAAFVTLFPQIVAGPIVRYEDIADELEDRRIDVDTIWDGILQFVAGLGKKVLIANNIGTLWDTVKVMDFNTVPVATAWLGIAAYTLQIYFDFSGYSDMAVGMGKILGFHFPKNFDYPYESKSITEFWRRWHMTLSGWFKSYVYFPLGGSKKGFARMILNTAIVWFLTGVWHGASWNFIVWGCMYGVIIIMEKVITTVLKNKGKENLLNKIPNFVKHIYAMVLVSLGWVLFDTDSLSMAFTYMKRMFSFGSTFADNHTTYLLLNFGILLIVAIIGCTSIVKKLAEKLAKRQPSCTNILSICYMIIVFLLSTAYLVDASYNPFLYFNF
ncbi:MAG: MBOAT family protein [Coprococcus sp.]|nr:MBOAT family protein [Coprococcus sp.]